MKKENTKHFREKCRICGTKDWSMLYKGPIRMGNLAIGLNQTILSIDAEDVRWAFSAEHL